MTGPAPVIATPLRTEHAALRSAVPGVRVERTGRGVRRSASWVRDRPAGSSAVLVTGVAGGLTDRLVPGDLVVATEVRGAGPVRECPSAPLLAAALRRRGLSTSLGPVTTATRVVTGAARHDLARTGALAVDTESAVLAAAAGSGPLAVVRAVVDTPDHPLLDLGTPARGLRALRALRAAGPALSEWAAALGPREIVLAAPRSFCAGVERAIDAVEGALDRHGAPVYVRRQIVHNSHVVRRLEERGAVFVDEVDAVPSGAVLVLAAHGVAPSVRAAAAERDLTVIDATCPLVAKVHAEVRRHARRGETVVLIGHAGHEEVVGTLGEAPGQVRVVGDVEEAGALQVPDPGRVAYVTQTTLAVEEAERIAAVLGSRFPALRAPRRDDICYATTNRQQAVRALARQTDLILVLGSANSSNSLRLAEVADRAGCPARLVEDAGSVDLRDLAGASRIGVTAGASAPPHLVDDLVHCLTGLGPVSVREERVIDEDLRFALPLEGS